jgi:hypothetical protein
MRRSIFVLLFIVACSNNAALAALVQWKVEDGGNGHFYEAVSALGITWNEAVTATELRGGYLVTITSQSEQDFISSYVISDGFGYRTGGYQPAGSPEPDGNWQWITGESFIYTNWWREEPNNELIYGGEDTIVLWSSNCWNDGPANYNAYNGYVVEIVPEPSTLLILGLCSTMLMAKW